MDKSEIITVADDFAKELSRLSGDERQVVKGIIIGLKLKSETNSDDSQKGA